MISLYIYSALGIRSVKRDLKRVAQTSPHLLCDLGFTQDCGGPPTGWDIWRKDEIIISLSRTDPTVIVTGPWSILAAPATCSGQMSAPVSAASVTAASASCTRSGPAPGRVLP